MPKRTSGLVRVVFELEPGQWHGTSTERLWAERVGSGRYRLDNSPFFAFGVSYNDVVFAEDRDGQLFFTGVSTAGGHSTYRLKLAVKRTSANFNRHWQPLQRLGCSYEEGEVLSVDVPVSADIYAAYQLLATGRSGGVWELEEGHCGHPLRGSRGDPTEGST
jgi:hypothetical protein